MAVPKLRGVPRAIVLVTALAASIASAPVGQEVTGALDDRSVTLEPEASRSIAFRAQLARGGEGAGQIALTCASADETTGGSLTLRIASDTSGAASEVDVADVATQPQTSLAIDAFTGCTDGACEERGVVAFERDDGPGAAPLVMVWRLDASFSPADGDSEGNTIEISVVE